MEKEREFSDYHNNVDFAVLFNFGDNDFECPMLHGAKLFCDKFNDLLYKIDSHEWGREGYIKSFEELCKEDTIKEILKLGFFAHQFEREASCISYITHGTPKLQNALDNINHYLEYIPWDKNRKMWERDGDKFVQNGEIPRFLVGTKEIIENELIKYGTPWEDKKEDDVFPVWCNGEVLIMYMRQGYLTYLTR